MTLTNEQCDALWNSLPVEFKNAVIIVSSEYDNCLEKHPMWEADNYIKGAAIVGEETGELIRAALRFTDENGVRLDMYNEATQVAAVAIRFLIELCEMKNEGGSNG